MLIHDGRIVLVDFETAHLGDPAFDLGFFLSHLMLKSFRAASLNLGPERYLDLTRQFWQTYSRETAVDSALLRRALDQTAACMMARIDGKSPVDYRHELDQPAIRRFTRDILMRAPVDWDEFLARAARNMNPG
jgi:5-methylthioribose kinase